MRSHPLGGHARRRSLSLDGSVPGIEYNRQHRPYSRGAFDGTPQIGPAQPSQAYDPDPGSPEFHESEYEAYHWSFDGHPTPPLRLDPVERPPVERVPTYETGVRLAELMSDNSQEWYDFPGRESLSSSASESAALDADERGKEDMGGLRSLDGVVSALWPAADMSRQISTAMDQQLADSAIDFCPNAPLDAPSQEQEVGLDHLMDSLWNEQMRAVSPFQEQQMENEWMQQMHDPFGMMGPLM